MCLTPTANGLVGESLNALRPKSQRSPGISLHQHPPPCALESCFTAPCHNSQPSRGAIIGWARGVAHGLHALAVTPLTTRRRGNGALFPRGGGIPTARPLQDFQLYALTQTFVSCWPQALARQAALYTKVSLKYRPLHNHIFPNFA